MDPSKKHGLTPERGLALALPVVACVAFAMALLLERDIEGSDLHVVVPHVLAAGQRTALRAFLFEDVEALAGPTLAPVDVEIELRAGDRVLSRTTLNHAPTGDAGGTLDVPDRPGRAVVVGRVTRDGETLSVEVPVEIARHAPEIPARERPTLPTQVLAHFATRPEPGQVAPSILELRAEGGTCVPELPCEVLVLVGEPAASIAIEDAPALHGVRVDDRETTGLVRASFVVRGPSAELDLVARRGGAVVARRHVRLPVTLGIPQIELTRASRVRARGATSPLVLDVFRDGRWDDTRTLEPDRETELAIPRGLSRIQVRTDALATDSAATRVLYGAPSPAAALRAVCERSNDIACHAGLTPDAQAVAYVLSPFEAAIVTTPSSVGGAAQASARATENKVHARNFGALFAALGALLFVVVFSARGLRASREARNLLEAAGDETAHDPRKRLRMTMVVIGLAGMVGLAFVGVAVLLLARSLLL